MLRSRYTGRDSSLTVVKPVVNGNMISLKRFFSGVSSQRTVQPRVQKAILPVQRPRVLSQRVEKKPIQELSADQPLPSVTSSRFRALLQLKIAFIGERSELKNSMKICILTEIINVFQEIIQGHFLDGELRTQLFKSLKANIIHPIPRFDGVLGSDEPMSKKEDPAWAVRSYCYQLLIRMQTFNPRLSFFDTDFILQLVEIAGSSEASERDAVTRFLEVHMTRNAADDFGILKKLANILSMGIEDPLANPFRIGIILRMMLINLKNLSSFSHGHKVILEISILPLVKNPYLLLFSKQMGEILDIFSDEDRRLCTIIVKSLLRYWPRSRSAKQSIFMIWITRHAAKMSSRDFVQNISKIFGANAACIDSPLPSVTESSLLIWSSLPLEPLIKMHCATIFPIVVPAIMSASKTQHEEQRSIVNHIARVMNTHNPKLYRELMNKQSIEKDALEKLRGWSAIARVACTAGGENSYIEKQKEIDKIFMSKKQ